MYVINKKRIKIIISCVLLSLLAFSLHIAQTEEIKNQTTLQTTSTPVSGKVVILDAGHRSA